MKKNVLMKGILLLLVIALLTIGLTGCGTIIPCNTGTVYISTPYDDFWYYIYIDGVYWGETDGSGYLTLYNVPIGNHTFYAEATDCNMLSCWYGYAYPYIVCGTNNVPIYTYWY
jgi:uncharacterized protein YceK